MLGFVVVQTVREMRSCERRDPWGESERTVTHASGLPSYPCHLLCVTHTDGLIYIYYSHGNALCIQTSLFSRWIMQALPSPRVTYTIVQ